MTPITRQDILAYQAVVPWAAQYQVEQDLLLCRAMTMVWAWCKNRSSTAEAMELSLLKIEGFCWKGLLVVSTMEPCSQRRLMTWKRRSAPCWSLGR